MPNAIYPLYKQALLNGSANTNMSSGTVRVALVDTGTYTYSAAHLAEIEAERVKRRRKRDIEAVLMLAA